MKKEISTHEYSPLARYQTLIQARNRKVEQGISLYLWRDGHELKGDKKSLSLKQASESLLHPR